MSLATKYRPKTFDEFLDNEITKQSIKSLLDRETDRPHVFLLTGPKGSGKTSLARIMANYINCHSRDISELNFSDTRGIDTARDLIESSGYLPRFGPVKVTIIDEFHQGTKDAFNALLKLFEEPPEASYFFLCTTDPQKIIPTIKDRCYIYTLEYLGSDSLSNLLLSIVKSEKKKVSKNIIEKIVEKSDGSARNALIMLDKIIDIPSPDLKQIENLMEEEDAEIKELCQLLLKKGTWKKVAEVIKKIKVEPETVRYAVLGYMNAVLLNSGSTQAALIIECFKKTFFYTSKAGLTSACFAVLMEE
jgi:DNA polymerase III subunit gamma/tau